MDEKQIATQIKREVLIEIENHLKTIADNHKKIFQTLQSVEDKTDEMYLAFSSTKGFWSVSGTILKGLILVSTGIGVIIGFIKFLKTGNH